MNPDNVKNQIQELDQLERQTLRFRRLTIVALVAIVLAGTSAMINSVYTLALDGPKQDAFVKNLSANLQKDVLPVVQKITSSSVARIKPAVDREVDRINARAPEIAGVALKELDALGNELPARAEKVLDETVGSTLHGREVRLRKMYPKSYDAKISDLVDNLNAEAQAQIAETSGKIFNPHLNSISGILTSLDKIQKTETLADQKDIGSMQVAYLFTDVFVSEFNDFGVNGKSSPALAVSPSSAKHIKK